MDKQNNARLEILGPLPRVAPWGERKRGGLPAGPRGWFALYS